MSNVADIQDTIKNATRYVDLAMSYADDACGSAGYARDAAENAAAALEDIQSSVEDLENDGDTPLLNALRDIKRVVDAAIVRAGELP